MQIVLDVSEFQSLGQLDQLLRNADDEIVAVSIKATQGEEYRDSLASAFAQCCIKHNTPFLYYDYLSDEQAADQEAYFQSFVQRQPPARLRRMLDCEGSYDKYAAGVVHFDSAIGGKPSIVYASLSNMPNYASISNPKWVAEYDHRSYYRPSTSEINDYRSQGYLLWQWTSNYMGLNQDASVLLGPFSELLA